MLVKVKALPGAQRTEVLQIAEVFRANVADLGTETIILSVVGDPGKVSELAPKTTLLVTDYWPGMNR